MADSPPERLSVKEWKRRADEVPDRGQGAPAFWAALHAIADHADHDTGGNAFPDYPRLERRVKRGARKIRDDLKLAEAAGLVVSKQRRNLPKVYQLAWPAGATPEHVATSLERLRAGATRKRWTGPTWAGPGSAPRGPVSHDSGSAPVQHSGSAHGGHSGSAPAGAAYHPLPPSTEKQQQETAAAAALSLAREETSRSQTTLSANGPAPDGLNKPAESRTTLSATQAPSAPSDVDRAIEIRLAEMRAAGNPPRSEGAMRRKLRGEFETNPDEVREVLARGGPPVLTAAGAAYRERLLALADEAMSRLQGGTADALRRLAKQIREQGDRAVPDETPEEVAERERDYRRALATQQEVA